MAALDSRRLSRASPWQPASALASDPSGACARKEEEKRKKISSEWGKRVWAPGEGGDTIYGRMWVGELTGSLRTSAESSMRSSCAHAASAPGIASSHA
eukprot:2811167-Rhodomonas_salina.2